MDAFRAAYRPLPQLGPGLSFQLSHWNPLTRSDFQLSFDDPTLSPTYHLSQYLVQPPFLRISLSPSTPPVSDPSPREGLLVIFGLSPNTLSSVNRLLSYLNVYDAVVSVSLAHFSSVDPLVLPLLESIGDGRYLHISQPLPLALSEAHWLLCQPLSVFRSLSPRTACLDYYDLPPDVYTTIFGMSWLNYPHTNDMNQPAPGLAQSLLSFFHSLHLPYDKGGSLTEMRQAYWRRLDSDLLLSNSLTTPQSQIDALHDLAAADQLRRSLMDPPFCAITLAPPTRTVPFETVAY